MIELENLDIDKLWATFSHKKELVWADVYTYLNGTGVRADEVFSILQIMGLITINKRDCLGLVLSATIKEPQNEI